MHIFGQNIYPISTKTPVNKSATLVAANTAIDGTGTIVILDTAKIYGTRYDKITFVNSQKVAAKSSAMSGEIFIMDSIGAWRHYPSSVLLDTATRSPRRSCATGSLTFPGGLILKNGTKIGAIISVYAGEQDRTDVILEGGNY